MEAALNTPNAVWVTPNGDIYIADTLNNRVRMIDHTTGFIRTLAGDGEPGVSREQAQRQIAAESVRFMDRLAHTG